jgi:hypothetical protein
MVLMAETATMDDTPMMKIHMAHGAMRGFLIGSVPCMV